MLPISNVIFAKSYTNESNSNIDWILFDIYKIATIFPLEVSIYGYIFLENTLGDDKNQTSNRFASERFMLADKFLSKSTRDDLKGLQLTCGLGVRIFFGKNSQSLILYNQFLIFFN